MLVGFDAYWLTLLSSTIAAAATADYYVLEQ